MGVEDRLGSRIEGFFRKKYGLKVDAERAAASLLVSGYRSCVVSEKERQKSMDSILMTVESVDNPFAQLFIYGEALMRQGTEKYRMSDSQRIVCLTEYAKILARLEPRNQAMRNDLRSVLEKVVQNSSTYQLLFEIAIEEAEQLPLDQRTRILENARVHLDQSTSQSHEQPESHFVDVAYLHLLFFQSYAHLHKLNHAQDHWRIFHQFFKDSFTYLCEEGSAGSIHTTIVQKFQQLYDRVQSIKDTLSDQKLNRFAVALSRLSYVEYLLNEWSQTEL